MKDSFFAKAKLNRLKKLMKLRYAFTELILITLGVSIALLFQNWNDSMKETNLEQKLLRELSTSIIDDIDQMNTDIIENQTIVDRIDSLLVLMEKDITYRPDIDSLIGSTFWVTSYFPNLHTYETLKSIGLNVIKNDSLRIGITSMYEQSYKYKSDIFDMGKLFWDKTIPFGLQNFQRFDLMRMTPNDFDALKKNKEFKTILSSLRYFRLLDKTATKKALKSAERVVKSLGRYLNDKG